MEEWKEYKLGELATFKYGSMPKKEKINKIGIYPIYSGYRIVGKYDEYNLENSELIIVARGVGGTGDAKLSPPKCFLTNLSIAVFLNENILLKKYAYYYFTLNNLRYLDSGSAQSQITINDLSKVKLNLPPLPTQQKIARVLSSLDDKIELNNKINANLEEQAQAIFKSWFVDFEPFGGKMPVGWKVGKLSEIGTIVGGSTPSKAKKEYYTKNGISWITPKDLSNDKSKFISHGETDITELGFKNSSAIKMPNGTVLYSSRAPIGYIAIAKNEVTTNQGFKSVIPNPNVGNAYIYYFLKSNFELIDNMASGSTFKEISGTAMKNVPVLIPDDSNLSAFQSFCDSIFSEQEKLEEENKTLASLRDTLLPKLMNGEIDVDSVQI